MADNMTVRRPFPRGPLAAALGLVLFSLGAAAFGRLTDIGTVRVDGGQPVAVRDILFEQRGDGAIVVREAHSADKIAVIAPGKDNFIRGAMRGLARERTRYGGAAAQPFRLIRWESGRLSLSDTTTGQRIYLDAFGPTNAGAFARFLEENPT